MKCHFMPHYASVLCFGGRLTSCKGIWLVFSLGKHFDVKYEKSKKKKISKFWLGAKLTYLDKTWIFGCYLSKTRGNRIMQIAPEL